MMKKLPGSKHVSYEHSLKHHTIDLYLDRPPVKVHVSRGIFWVLIDSRKLAPDFMKMDQAMTANLRHAREICDDAMIELAENWVGGTLDCSEDSRAPERGPKDWSPGGEQFRYRGKVNGQGNTYNYEDSKWQGDVFEYVTFKLPENRDGLAVFWHLGGDPRGNYDQPEVWIGDVDEFLSMQWMDMREMEEVHSLNADFDNGIVWALEKLHLLGPKEGVLDAVDETLQEMIEDTPELLSEKTRKDVLAHPKNYAEWVVDAVESI